jgi:8-oxo-dGTP pyrophosphatase MutT (NUDIX family)
MSFADFEALRTTLIQRLLPLSAAETLSLPSHSDWDLTGGRPLVTAQALKPAGVLVALVARPEGPTVILTRRTDDMPTHAGQVAFPGGRVQADDATIMDAALREAQEEVGLDPALVDVIGLGDAWHSVTSYHITPVVGLVSHPPTLQADPREVAAVFEVPFSFLMDPANHIRETRHWNGQDRHYWTMPWQGHHIWGATAGMLRALALRLNGATVSREPA